jgi:hypothetical protein
MSLKRHLIALGSRQVLREPAERFVQVVQRHFTDHTQAFTEAIARANVRTGQSPWPGTAGAPRSLSSSQLPTTRASPRNSGAC